MIPAAIAMEFLVTAIVKLEMMADVRPMIDRIDDYMDGPTGDTPEDRMAEKMMIAARDYLTDKLARRAEAA